MSALGHTYRWQVYNGTGVTVTTTLKARQGKYGSDGAFAWAAESTPISAVGVSTLSYSNSSPIDNSADKYTQAEVTLSATPASAPAAGTTLALYLQRSTDGGTTWPENGAGALVAAITFAAATTTRTVPGLIR